MNTKELVYSILSDNIGSFVSGEALASKAGVSRASIWKAVSALQAEGFEIEGVSRKGYRLCEKDIFTERSIAAHLKTIPFYFYEETDSTNTRAKNLIAEGVKTPFVTIAASQNGGRGRRGRSFISSVGGIYFSIALEVNGSLNVESITTAAATGVARAIDSLGFDSSIKWVNDIYINGKKCVGILTEGVINMEDNSISEVIIGIGINYETKSFPPDIEAIVTSLYPDKNAPLTRSAFLALVINEVLKALKDPLFLSEYKKKCFVIGKEINVITPSGIKEAKAIDLDDKAHLVVRFNDGKVEHLSSGDVTIRTR